MNRSCKNIVGVFLAYFFAYLIIVLTTNKSFKEGIPLPYYIGNLHLILSTIFLTISLMFLFLWFFSTSPSQTTTAAFGLTASCAMGLYHLLVVLGLDVIDAQASLLQMGGWTICVPLIFVMFGHIFKIQERYVLIGGALEFCACLLMTLGSLSPSKRTYGLCGLLAILLYLPVVFVICVLCFKLHHFSSTTQLYEIRMYGCLNTVWYLLYTAYYCAISSGVVSDFTQNIMEAVLELLLIAALYVLVFCFQFKNQIGSYEIKLVDMQKANAAQKLFLRFIFHEVRVPFHSLLLGLEYLAAQEGLDEYQSLFATLIQSAEMMERTINDVLLLSRLEDGRLELQPTPFSPTEMISMTLHSFKPMLESKELSLESEIDPELPPLLHGDQHRISQIIANLVSNAIKFSKEKSTVHVAISVIDQSINSCFFQLQVKDEGLGMTAEEQKLLFTPYSQIRPHETQQGRGSGLGLSIVKHIVELHEGSITVTSEPNKGSTFAVTLRLPIGHLPPSSTSNKSGSRFNFPGSVFVRKGPLFDVTKKTPRVFPILSLPSTPTFQTPLSLGSWVHHDNFSRLSSRMNSSRTSARPSARLNTNKSFSNQSHQNSFKSFSNYQNNFSLRPRCVLLVDDSQTNRRLTRLILEQQGLIVEEACNGQEAVDMAEQKEYWVIFMDNQMPVMNGVTATKKICQFSPSPIIGLTGNSLDEDVKEFISAGAKSVLIKPCKREKILNVITALDFEDRKPRAPRNAHISTKKIAMNHA